MKLNFVNKNFFCIIRVLGNQISNVPKEEGFSHVEAKHVLQKQQSIVSNKLLNEENTSRSATRRNKESSETSSATNQGFVFFLVFH